jgi:hypothetical protein
MSMIKPWILSQLVIAGCTGSSPVDRLCNTTSGVWTLQQVDLISCSAAIDRKPMYTPEYMEQNCRATLQPMFDAGDVTIASDAVLEMCRVALTTPCTPELRKDWVAATKICDDILIGRATTGEPCSDSPECAAGHCVRNGACGHSSDGGRESAAIFTEA